MYRPPLIYEDLNYCQSFQRHFDVNSRQSAKKVAPENKINSAVGLKWHLKSGTDIIVYESVSHFVAFFHPQFECLDGFFRHHVF